MAMGIHILSLLHRRSDIGCFGCRWGPSLGFPVVVTIEHVVRVVEKLVGGLTVKEELLLEKTRGSSEATRTASRQALGPREEEVRAEGRPASCPASQLASPSVSVPCSSPSPLKSAQHWLSLVARSAWPSPQLCVVTVRLHGRRRRNPPDGVPRTRPAYAGFARRHSPCPVHSPGSLPPGLRGSCFYGLNTRQQ